MYFKVALYFNNQHKLELWKCDMLKATTDDAQEGFKPKSDALPTVPSGTYLCPDQSGKLLIGMFKHKTNILTLM